MQIQPLDASPELNVIEAIGKPDLRIRNSYLGLKMLLFSIT